MPALFAKPAPPSDDKRWKIVETRMRRMGDRPSALIEALHAAQEAFGFLDEDALHYVGDTLGVPHSRVYGVATFYSFFTTQPRGRHTIKFCMGTACYVGGMPQLIEKAKQVLGIQPGETTKDGAITMELCRCVGACSQAPVVVVDEEAVGRVKPNKFPQVLRKVQEPGA